VLIDPEETVTVAGTVTMVEAEDVKVGRIGMVEVIGTEVIEIEMDVTEIEVVKIEVKTKKTTIGN